MDYRKKLDEARKTISKKARDLDAKYGVGRKIEQAEQSASEAFERARATAARQVQIVREEFERLDQQYNVSERFKETTSDFTSKAKRAAQTAEEKVQDVLGGAAKYYERVDQASRTVEGTMSAAEAIGSAVNRAREWVKENPGKAAVVSFSVVAGTRVGAAWPRFEAIVLGAGGAGNWVFHSALAPYGLRKVAESYFDYLKRQDLLIAAGLKTEAEVSRLGFQRKLAKYVGAPLIGAFSLAAGSALIVESFSGAAVSGAPLSLILGGSPLLASIWLFTNGLVCIHSGYRVFLLAFADDSKAQEFWERIRAMKALPASPVN